MLSSDTVVKAFQRDAKGTFVLSRIVELFTNGCQGNLCAKP